MQHPLRQQQQQQQQQQVPLISFAGDAGANAFGQQALQVVSGLMQQMQQMQQVQAATLQVLQQFAQRSGSEMPAIMPPAQALSPVMPLENMQHHSLQDITTPPSLRRLQSQIALDSQPVQHGELLRAAPRLSAPAEARALAEVKAEDDEVPEPKEAEISQASKKVLKSKAMKKSAAAAATAAIQAALQTRKAGKEGAAKAKAQPKKQAVPKAKPCKKEPEVKQTKKEQCEVVKPPSFGVERSRSQVVCRTGRKGPGQTMTITFASAGGETAAVNKAKKWLAAERKKRKIS